MFTRPPGLDWLVNVRPTMLDEHGWYEPFVETFTDEKLPWASTTARHSYRTLPNMSEFEPLMKPWRRKARGRLSRPRERSLTARCLQPRRAAARAAGAAGSGPHR
jgi:hypothetical protein